MIINSGRTYVRGVGGNVSKSTLGGNSDDVLLQLSRSKLLDSEGRVRGGLEGDKVGKQASNVRRGHGSAGDDVGGVVAANPGGQDVETRSEDVSALSVVGEVGTLIRKSRGTNSDGLLSSSRRIVASISVVVTRSNGEVKTSLNTSVNSILKGLGLATTETHVGNAALESLNLAVLGILGLLDVSLDGILDTRNDIGHGARAARPEDLDGIEVGLLGNTILLTSHGSGAVSSVTIAIEIFVVGRDCLAPSGTALKVNVVNVDTSVNGVGVNTLTTLGGIEVLVEVAEGQAITVRDTSQTPGGVLFGGPFHSVNFGVPLDVVDLH